MRQIIQADNFMDFTDDFLKALNESNGYADDMLKQVPRYGKAAEDAIAKYGDEAAEVINEYGDEAVDGLKNGKSPDEIWNALDSGELVEETKPSKQPDILAEPRGKRTEINYSKMDEETIRSLTRENEAADTLARAGYDVEQNPIVEGSKNPDYLIEGRIFDCYSPKGSTPIENIYKNIKGKIDARQTNRVVLNLDDWHGGGGKIEDIIAILKDYPINGLEEVIGINHFHQVIDIY